MCARLIPFPELYRPGRNSFPADFFARVRRAACALPVLIAAWVGHPAAGLADADPEGRTREPIYRPMRPANTAEFLTRCKEDSLYCEEQFTSYVQRYLAVRVEEFARLEEYRKMRENLRDKQAFDGICLPRERILTDDFPTEMSRKFRSWAEKNKQVHAERPPVGIKAAMQAIYPCP